MHCVNLNFIHENPIKKIITSDIYQWKDVLKNDFERPVFAKYPQLAKIKYKLYDYGAIYASLSGSGSCVYGIFDGETQITQIFKYRLHRFQIVKRVGL